MGDEFEVDEAIAAWNEIPAFWQDHALDHEGFLSLDDVLSLDMHPKDIAWLIDDLSDLAIHAQLEDVTLVYRFEQLQEREQRAARAAMYEQTCQDILDGYFDEAIEIGGTTKEWLLSPDGQATLLSEWFFDVDGRLAVPDYQLAEYPELREA